MIEFLRRNRFLATAAFFLVVAAALVLRSAGARWRDDGVGRVLLEIMAPLQALATRASRAVTDAWDGAAGMWWARQEAERLRRRVTELERDTARLDELALENARLRELLSFRRGLEGTLITGRVIGHDAAGLSRTITIDQGSAAGVAKGAAVLAPGGLVGQVFVVSPHAARALLITDHNSGVDAVVQRTRGRGIVEGTVDGHCGLKFVKRTEDLQVGDLLLSSGLDGVFPPGVPIGRITTVDKQGQGLFQYAQVEPAVDVDALDEVLITLGPVAPAVLPDGVAPEGPPEQPRG